MHGAGAASEGSVHWRYHGGDDASFPPWRFVLLACGTDYLLGSAPCRGDFSLYGQLWAGLYRDPHSRHLFGAAPHVVSWFERLHGHEADPAFPSDAVRPAGADADAPPGRYLPSDEVPATLEPLLRAMFEEQWPFLVAASSAVDAHVAANPGSTPLPRSS